MNFTKISKLFLTALLIPFYSFAQPVHLQGEKDIIWRDFLGVNAHFLWFTPAQYQQQMTRLKDLGLEWTRVDIHWDRHELSQGKYRLAELDQLAFDLKQQKLKTLMYIVGSATHATSAPKNSSTPDQYPPTDPRLYADMMGKMVKRYPHIDAWQVWNEPNLPTFWRPHEDPEAYGKLLLTTVQHVRKVAPETNLVMGGMAYYSQMPVKGGLMLEALGNLGVAQLKITAAYHPYTHYPEGNETNKPDFLVHSTQLNNLIGRANMPIWATEWGWSSYKGPKEHQAIIGASGQADYVLRRLALMTVLNYDKVFLFALSDLDSRASERDQYYGLLDVRSQPKPVYYALKNFLKTTGDRLKPGRRPLIIKAPNDIYSVSWQREDGKNLWMFWSASAEEVSLGAIESAVLIDPLTGSSRDLTVSQQKVKLKAKPSLQILLW